MIFRVRKTRTKTKPCKKIGGKGKQKEVRLTEGVRTGPLEEARSSPAPEGKKHKRGPRKRGKGFVKKGETRGGWLD